MLSNRLEAKVKMKDGTTICTHIFRSTINPEKPNGICLLTHGQGEHGLAYQKIVAKLDPHLEYWCWDLRGHGVSDGTRGYVSNFTEYVKDWAEIFEIASSESKHILLLGHSMGGLITTIGLKSLGFDSNNLVKGVILSSPLFGLALRVPALKQKAAKLLQSSGLHITLGNEIEPQQLKRNPQSLLEHSRDQFRHQKISAGAYLGMLSSCESLKTEDFKIQIPTFLNLGLKDPIIDLDLAREVASAHFEPLTISEMPDALHEPLNDYEQDLVCQKITEFIKNLKF